MRVAERSIWVVTVGLCGLGSAASAEPMGTAFTYQGQLRQGGVLVESACDFEFSLWDAASGGGDIPPLLSVTVPADEMNDGLFTVTLDFGAGAFDGNARWLEIRVSCPPGAPFVLLGRQELTPAPYAIHAASGPSDGSLWTLNGSSDIFYNDGNVGIGTDVPRGKLHIEDGDLVFRDPVNPANEQLLRFMITGTGVDSRGYKFSWRNDDLTPRLKVHPRIPGWSSRQGHPQLS